MLNRRGSALLAGVFTILAACDDGPASLPDLTVASVSVAPAGQTIMTGETMKLTVYPKAADGTVLGGRVVVWSSEVADIASVSADGTVLGRQPGTTRIHATVEGRTGSVEVTVAAGPLAVAGIVIVNAPGSLGIGQQVLLEAILRAADGTVIGGRTVTWRSSHGPTASVTRDPNPVFALLSAHAPGTVVITAEAENHAASVTVTVNAPAGPVGSIVLGSADADVWVNGSYVFDAVVRTPTGEPHPNAPALLWSVDDPTVARIDATGRVRGLVPGTTTVRATAAGVQGSAKVTVHEFLVNDLQFDVLADVDPDGAARTVELGTLTWYGEDPVYGTPAREILRSGTIRVQIAGGTATYQHYVRFDVVDDDGAAGRTVAFGSISDSGTVVTARDPSSDGPALIFTSSNPQNDTFYGRVAAADRIVLRQRLGAAQMQEYIWIRP